MTTATRCCHRACRARVSVEAAALFGWHRWVGELGEAIGMTTFGASAPAAALYNHFGFTPERIAETAEVRAETCEWRLLDVHSRRQSTRA